VSPTLPNLLPRAAPTSRIPNTHLTQIHRPQVTYTLKCLGPENQTLTKTATVNILPTFQEI